VMTEVIVEGGHEVAAFADGREALERIAGDGEVRALITSTQPFGISGIELCAAARRLSGTRRALHVMLMSSTTDYYLASRRSTTEPTTSSISRRYPTNCAPACGLPTGLQP
jgi:CheY-like chemotaxis protein